MNDYPRTIYPSATSYWRPNSGMLSLLAIVCLFLLTVITPAVLAGTGGAEFLPLTTWFRDLITGNLGRLIAFAALAVGGIIGIARLTGMPMGAAFLIAILLVFGVTIIENIVTATV